MADAKITALTAVTAPDNADLLATVQDVSTSPVTKKVTWTVVKAFLKTYFDGLYLALQPTTIELGHASDTTLSRSAAGVLAVEGTAIPKGTGTANELTYWSGTNVVGTLAVATYPSLTELSYVKGVTSAIQTQLNGKQATLTNPVTGTGTINELAYWTSGSAVGTLAVATYPSLTELSYVKGVTSALQTQLNGKAATLSGTQNEIAYFSSASGIASLAVATYPSLTELSYVKGVTSAIQTQLGTKAPTASPTFTGTVTIDDNARIDLTLPTADTYCTGNTTDSFAAGYSSAVGDLVFFGSGGKWLEADADAVATCQGLMGIALEAKTDTQAMKVALPGSFVRLDAWNWTVGATLYAGETLGAMQETIPTGGDAIIKPVAFAVSGDVVFFYPSPNQQSTVA